MALSAGFLVGGAIAQTPPGDKELISASVDPAQIR
jgi:hypothetical protein